jgi:hypothetical protein
VPLEVIWAKFFAKMGDPDRGRNLKIERASSRSGASCPSEPLKDISTYTPLASPTPLST